LPELLLSDFLLWSKNFKGSFKTENEVLRVFSLRTIYLAELGAQESTPPSNILHPCSRAATTMEVATTAVTTVETMATKTPFGLHPMCCQTCRQSIGDLYTLVDECLQAMEAMKHRMEDLEHVVGDNYKFLNRNVRKLFGMVGNMRGKWCNTCLKYH
jgi:hypothetical protein